MEVLVRKNPKWKHKCKYCGSIYTYTAKEVDYYWHPTVRCPVCENRDEVSIFDKKVKE